MSTFVSKRLGDIPVTMTIVNKLAPFATKVRDKCGRFFLRSRIEVERPFVKRIIEYVFENWEILPEDVREILHALQVQTTVQFIREVLREMEAEGRAPYFKRFNKNIVRDSVAVSATLIEREAEIDHLNGQLATARYELDVTKTHLVREQERNRVLEIINIRLASGGKPTDESG